MPIDLQFILDNEREFQGDSFTRTRYAFPVANTAKIDPGEYVFRLLPNHDEKNPFGFMRYNTNFIAQSKTSKFSGKTVLHPTSFKDPKDPNVYWGLDTMLKQLETKADAEGVKLVDKHPVFKGILEEAKMRRAYRIPCLFNATEIRTPNPKNLKYPKLTWEEAPDPMEPPMADVTFEFKAGQFADMMFALMKINPNLNDAQYGYNLIFKKESQMRFSVELGEQCPLTSAQLALFAGDKYPDMWNTATKVTGYDPDAIVGEIKKAWYYSKLEGIKIKAPEHVFDMGLDSDEEAVSNSAVVGADDL